MAITTRSEYGLRAMVLLAEQLGDERLSASEISRREEIPLKYLEQILAELKRAALVQSRAGARGGYQLARPAPDICVGDVVRALDGPVTPVQCAALERGSDGDSGPPKVGERLRPLWLKLQDALRSVLDHTTLDQLAFTTRLDPGPSVAPVEPSETGEGPPMYHI